MGFPKWLKPVGKVGLEVGKAAGIAALSNPAIGLAIQIVNASLSSGQVTAPELIKTLNTLLIPEGFMVIELPKDASVR